MAKGRNLNAPFMRAAQIYRDMGWSPIPLAAREKSPVPNEFTGALGRYVDELQLRKWLKGEPVHVGKMTYTPSNIALRMPKNVIGIDVDAYGEKAGEKSLAEAEEKWGKLPATWITTSRSLPSGIRLFRVPEGLAWPGTVGPGIEVVRWDHRYAMVYPSIHPEGREYGWINLKGKRVTDYAPSPAELPKMPKTWVKGLTSGAKWVLRAVEDMDASDMARWLSDRPEPDVPCKSMRAFVNASKLKLMKSGDDGGGHDVARDAAWGVLRDSGAGHAGVSWALGELRKAFLVAVEQRRGNEREAKGEWARLVQRGMGKVAAEGSLESADPCDLIAGGTIRSKSSVEGTSSDLELTELGNVARLAETVEGRLLWQEDMESWIIWDSETGLWRENKIQPERWAIKSLNNLLATVEKDDAFDPKQKSVVKAFWRTAQKPAGIASTLQLYRGRPGASVLSSAFDADGSLLGCPNGVLRLGPEGASFRRLLNRGDMLTFCTSAEYVPGAVSAEWDRFLERVQPSADVRAWLGRLVGYSLLGSNPARRIIICLGETTTGKGTFMGAVQAALGQYSGTANLTIFRDNQDERPRADLADAIFKRVIFIDEASRNWKLHPDQLKRMTGAGIISARRPFAKAAIERVPAFTPWLMTNSVPSIEGADKAVRRRLIVVPWDEELSKAEVDIMLAGRLVREAGPAILRWAVEGYNELMQMGIEEGLASPPEAWKAHERFTSEMSELDAFIANVCKVGDEYMERPPKLAEAWELWQDNAKLQGRDRMSPIAFAKALHANGYQQKTVSIEGGKVRMRIGLQLRENWESIAMGQFG